MSRRSLVDASVTLVSTRRFEGHHLRAVVTERPGGAPELVLERVDFGDEGEPFVVVRSAKVEHSALNHIDAVRWGEDRLYFTEENEVAPQKSREWYVDATSDRFGTKASRV